MCRLARGRLFLSKPKYEDELHQAIRTYIREHDYHVSLESIWCYEGYSRKRGILPNVYLAVFDPPPGGFPGLDAPDWDAPQYRAKPVMHAQLQADGSITVSETEYTQKYLVPQSKD